ncbi:hypothetical protein FACS1894123_04080 [Bacteroidia bacterium]|nr:hypothetical protein FACS1894123_04080 [Bacteroidia bacterium]
MTHIKISIMFLLVALTFSSVNSLYSQVTIGASEAPRDFSVLELMSDIKGLRLPQLTTAQRTALGNALTLDPSNAPAGLTIYNTTTNCLEYWNKQEWISLCDDVTNPALPLPGAGRFTGRTIFDIASLTNDGGACGTRAARVPYSTDFAQTEEQDATDGTVNGVSVTVTNPTDTWLYSGKQVYTFTPSVDVSNVWFNHVEDTSEPDAIISMTPKDPAAYLGDIPAGTPCKVVVEYNPTLMTKLVGKTRDQAVKPKLYVFYTDKADGRDYVVELTVSLQDCNCCGTAVTGDYWQNFLCYNLGANFMFDPFTPAKGLNGNYYQWGRKQIVGDVDDGLHISLNSWPGNFADRNLWGDDEDPCPPNYRVPTLDELREVNNIAINPQTIPSGATWITDLTNFSSGRNYGSVLYLPATGYLMRSPEVSRGPRDVAWTHRGSGASYWSDQRRNHDLMYALDFIKNSATITGNAEAQTARPIRCIAR